MTITEVIYQCLWIKFPEVLMLQKII